MNGLELALDVVKAWRRYRGTGFSAYENCQWFDGWYMQWGAEGFTDESERSIRIYQNARLAYEDSTIFTRNIASRSIQPGDLLYWEYGNPGHVATAIGWDGDRLLITNTAKGGDVVRKLQNHVKIHHADTVDLPFLGVSHTNGRNRRRTGITPYLINQKPTPPKPSTPKPQPAGSLKGMLDMPLYHQAAGQDEVYEISQGVRHYINPEAWLGIKVSFAAAGIKLPYVKGKLTAKQMNAIPLAKQ